MIGIRGTAVAAVADAEAPDRPVAPHGKGGTMRHASRLRLAVAIALIMLAATTASASANEMRIIPGGEVSATGNITFSAGMTVACDVTLAGTLVDETTTRAGEPLGEIIEAQSASCSGGRITGFLALPWSLDVTAALGTLPASANGISFTASDFALQVEALGIRCLYAGTLVLLLNLVATEDPLADTSGTVAVAERAIPLFSGGFLCPSTASASSSMTLTPQQTLAFAPGPAIARLVAEDEEIGMPFGATALLISNSADPGDDDLLINEIGLSDAVQWRVEDWNECAGDDIEPTFACLFHVHYIGDDDLRPRTVTVTVGTSVGPVAVRLTAESEDEEQD